MNSSSLDSKNIKLGTITKKRGFFLDKDEFESVHELQARILELESELKKQREVAEKGNKLMKLMYGDTFQSDSLH